jgi:hypothetical protein
MTTETKTFIELGDVIAIQFQCRKCGTTISRSVAESTKPIRECPTCQTLWAEHGTSEEKRVCNLALLIEQTKQSLEGRDFRFLLEIKSSTVGHGPVV